MAVTELLGGLRDDAAISRRMDVREVEPEFLEQTGFPREVAFPVEDRTNALAGDALEVIDLSFSDASAVRLCDDGFADGMFAALFEAARAVQHVFLAVAVQGNDVCHRELAFREGTRLVEGDDVHRTHRFEVVSSLDENAILRGARNARDDRDRRRDNERTWTRKDQQRQTIDNSSRPRCADNVRTADRHENSERDDDRGVVRREPFDELLAFSLV